MRSTLTCLAPLLPIVITLSACYTQPAKLPETAFRWTSQTVAGTPGSVYHVLQDRFRQCTYWAANCYLAADSLSASCDVSRRDVLSNTLMPAGMVTVSASSDSEVLVRAGSITPRHEPNDSPHHKKRRAQWVAMATGASCP